MKKIIYTLIGGLICINSFSQTLVKTDLEPQIGDNYEKHTIDNPASLDPGLDGLSQTWDLSNASYSSQNDYIYEIVDPSITPYTVPGATFVVRNYPVVGSGDSGYVYFKDTTNGYYVVKEIGYLLTLDYFPPEFIYKFPLSYGDSVLSNFNYSSTALGVTYNYSVQSKLKFDGVGTLYGGSAPIANVFRLVNTKEIIRQLPNDTSYSIKYMWYLAGIHHPLAEYVEYLDASGTSYIAANFYSLNNTTKINELDEEANFWAYPNPANEIVNINSETAIENIVVSDVTGKVISRLQNLNSNIYSLETKDFVDGMYFLQINSKQNSFSKKMIVRH